MAAGEIRAGRAFVELYLKQDIGKQLDATAKKLKAFGDGLIDIGKKTALVGAGLLAPLLLAAKGFAEMGDQVNKASQRTGIGVESLVALKYAAEQSGASFEDLESGVRKMQKFLVDVAGGGKESAEALKLLGINMSELVGLSPDEQFLRIADSLSDIHDPAVRADLAMKVFGKGGATLLPLIEEGADGIKELTDRARELGLVFDKDAAEAATKFGDILDDLQKQLGAIVFTVGSEVARALQPFAEGLTKILAQVIAWIKANKSLVLAVLGVGVALVTAGVALVVLGTTFKIVAGAIQGFQAAFAGLTAVVGLLTNPIFLIIAGLAALAAYFLFATETGQQCLGFLGEKFGELKDTALKAFGGISDALAAGDIVLAAKILWVGLQVLWAQGTAELMVKWAHFKEAFVQVAGAAFYGALEIYARVKASLLSAWEETVAVFGSVWDGFIGTFTDLWGNAVNLVTKGLNFIKGLWDDTFDADAANAAADDALANEQAQRRKAEVDRQAERERNRDASLADIEKQKTEAIDEINKREAALSEGATAAADQEIKDLDRKKTELEDELDDLRIQAKAKAAAAKGDNRPERKKPGEPDLESIMASSQKIQSAGTFNAAAISAGALNGGAISFLTRIATATEATVKAVKEKKAPTFG